MILVARWLRTAVSRAAGFADHARWILLSLALAGAGMVGLLAPLPAAINVTLASVSLVLLVSRSSPTADACGRRSSSTGRVTTTPMS